MRNLYIAFFAIVTLAVSGCTQKTEQKQTGTSSALPRSRPEAEGVSSEGILQFIGAADSAYNNGIEIHSMMILRHGKVIAEGWWASYRADLKHTMYSVSKSFTSTAIGFAVAEGKLKLTDKVVSFFPESLPDTVSPYLAELDVKDLLTMSVGQAQEPAVTVTDDWVKAFLAAPIENEPGTVFLYNSAGSFMLSAILQKVTGEKVIDYLKPRLFDPLGIEGAGSEVDPQGINTGGWGIRVKTEDMAKLGLLYLQKGIWNGKQLLPQEWVADATSKQIETKPENISDTDDWSQGYGYKFWQTTHHAVRTDGAFGQYIIMLPEKDAVIVLTAQASNMQEELNLVWNYLLPAFKDEKLPENKEPEQQLKDRLSHLSLPTYTEAKTSPLQENINGKIISLNENPLNIKELSLKFNGNVCTMTLKQDTTSYDFNFSDTGWAEGETLRHGPSLSAGAKGNLTGLPPYKVAGNYTWKTDNKLELVLRYIESPHNEKFVLTFSEPVVNMEYSSNIDNYQSKLQLNGKIEK